MMHTSLREEQPGSIKDSQKYIVYAEKLLKAEVIHLVDFEMPEMRSLVQYTRLVIANARRTSLHRFSDQAEFKTNHQKSTRSEYSADTSRHTLTHGSAC